MVFFAGSGFLGIPGLVFGLLSLEDLNGVFFSTAKVFFPSLARDERSIFLDVFAEMVKVFFFFFDLSLIFYLNAISLAAMIS